jgi:hypothetical protein
MSTAPNSGLATIFLRVSAQIPNLTYKKTAQGRGTLVVSAADELSDRQFVGQNK